MKEILINRCYGGFRLSNEVYEEMMKKQNKEVGEFDFSDDRENKDLIEIVKKLQDKANTKTSKLKIVKIPKEAFYSIKDYDGIETVVWSMSEINETW